jgi:hypothetical protein
LPHKVKVPASVASLDFDRVRKALFKADGNVTVAAKALKVKSADLRRLAWRHPKLIMDALERVHREIDKAEAKLREALDGDHKDRALAAAFFILRHSAAARERGWSRAGSGRDAWEPPPPAATVLVQWASETSGGYRPLAPNVPEARLASSSSGLAADDDRVH